MISVRVTPFCPPKIKNGLTEAFQHCCEDWKSQLRCPRKTTLKETLLYCFVLCTKEQQYSHCLWKVGLEKIYYKQCADHYINSSSIVVSVEFVYYSHLATIIVINWHHLTLH